MSADNMLPYLLVRKGANVESALGDVVVETKDDDDRSALFAEFSLGAKQKL